MSLAYYMSLGGDRAKLTLTVDNPSPIGIGTGFTPCGDVGSNADAVTLNVQNGKPPYSFSWTNLTTAEEGPFTISNPTGSANIFWQDRRCAAYNNNTETWRATVTDDNGETDFVDVDITLEWIDLS